MEWTIRYSGANLRYPISAFPNMSSMGPNGTKCCGDHEELQMRQRRPRFAMNQRSTEAGFSRPGLRSTKSTGCQPNPLVLLRRARNPGAQAFPSGCSSF